MHFVHTNFKYFGGFFNKAAPTKSRNYLFSLKRNSTQNIITHIWTILKVERHYKIIKPFPSRTSYYFKIHKCYVPCWSQQHTVKHGRNFTINGIQRIYPN
jgi:hypothetical protein